MDDDLDRMDREELIAEASACDRHSDVGHSLGVEHPLAEPLHCLIRRAVIMIFINVEAPISGMSMNPARTFVAQLDLDGSSCYAFTTAGKLTWQLPFWDRTHGHQTALKQGKAVDLRFSSQHGSPRISDER